MRARKTIKKGARQVPSSRKTWKSDFLSLFLVAAKELALGNPILQHNDLHNGRLGRPASIPHSLVEV